MFPFGPWLAALVALVLGATQPATRSAMTVQVVPTTIATAPPGPCREWYALALDAGWLVEQWPTVARVMRCESNCQPSAYNRRSGATGLMQVLGSWFGPDEDGFDPATNLAVARRVFERQGWRAWSCY